MSTENNRGNNYEIPNHVHDNIQTDNDNISLKTEKFDDGNGGVTFSVKHPESGYKYTIAQCADLDLNYPKKDDGTPDYDNPNFDPVEVQLQMYRTNLADDTADVVHSEMLRYRFNSKRLIIGTNEMHVCIDTKSVNGTGTIDDLDNGDIITLGWLKKNLPELIRLFGGGEGVTNSVGYPDWDNRVKISGTYEVTEPGWLHVRSYRYSNTYINGVWVMTNSYDPSNYESVNTNTVPVLPGDVIETTDSETYFVPNRTL